MATPRNPSYVDWSLHYPNKFSEMDHNRNRIVVNTSEYPVTYDVKIVEEEEEDKADYERPVPTILDVGCGYGGLMFELSKVVENEQLILGLEIREKPADYVGEKINFARSKGSMSQEASDNNDCQNIAVLHTNAMKTLHNYIRKEQVSSVSSSNHMAERWLYCNLQLSKMFFCFADPHFKRSNHRKRIINTALLTDYAYMLRPGGKLYIVTDVEQLHRWQVKKLDEHPMFEVCEESARAPDPCIEIMCTKTDEALRVTRKGGQIWHAVYKKRDATDPVKQMEIEADYCKFFQ